jgi:hypothetical protein
MNRYELRQLVDEALQGQPVPARLMNQEEGLDKYPTHCDIHNEHRPCQHCRDEEADRQYDSRKDK